jgi:hypothetical protein
VSLDEGKEVVVEVKKGNVKSTKFARILAQPTTDLRELRTLGWSGVPANVRAQVWQLLLGYLPTNMDRRVPTLEKRREVYIIHHLCVSILLLSPIHLRCACK